MIFVAVGTHHAPFDRLLSIVDALASERSEPFVVQRGVSRLPLRFCRVVDQLTPDALTEHLTTCRRLVLHGGSSLFLEARSLGRVPIVVPRRAAFGEHVDDHQVEFVASLPDGEVTRAEPEALRALLDREEQRRLPHDRAPAFCRGLDEQVAALLARRRDQR